MLWLINIGLTSADWRNRLQAVETLRSHESSRAIEMLERVLTDPVLDVRRAAAEALYRRTDWKPRTEQKARVAAILDSFDEVASYGDAGIPFLLDALKCRHEPYRKQDDYLQEQIIHLLAEMNTPAASEVIRDVTDTLLPKAQVAAALVLVSSDEFRAKRILLASLESPQPGARIQAAKALETFGDVDALPSLLRLAAWFRGERDLGASHAVELSIAWLANRTSFTPVVDALRNDSAPLREIARVVLVRSPKSAAPAVARDGCLDDPRILTTALEMLSKAPEVLVEPFLNLIEGNTVRGQNRLDVLTALGKTKDARIVGPLLRELQFSEDFTHCQAAIDGLANFNTLEVTTALSAACDHSALICRLAAIGALSKFRTREAFSALAKTVKHQDPECRIAAVRALATGDPDNVANLIVALGDVHEGCRAAAAESLANFPAGPVVSHLIAALNDSDCVAEAAAKSLAKLRVPDLPLRYRLISALANNNWKDAVAVGPAALDFLRARITRALAGEKGLNLRVAFEAFEGPFHPILIGVLIEFCRVPWFADGAAAIIIRVLEESAALIPIDELEVLSGLSLVANRIRKETWWDDSGYVGSWVDDIHTYYIVLDGSEIRRRAIEELRMRSGADVVARAEERRQKAVCLANLKAWQLSDEPWKWVCDKEGSWDNTDWISLIDALQRSEYWPMDMASVGAFLEQCKPLYGDSNRYRKLEELKRSKFYSITW